MLFSIRPLMWAAWLRSAHPKPLANADLSHVVFSASWRSGYRRVRPVGALHNSFKALALTEQTPENFAAMFETNVLGTLLSVKHELRVMQPRGAGSIVNISATMGERGAANLALPHLEEQPMQLISTIGLYIAKSVFQVHGVDAAGECSFGVN